MGNRNSIEYPVLDYKIFEIWYLSNIKEFSPLSILFIDGLSKVDKYRNFFIRQILKRSNSLKVRSQLKKVIKYITWNK